MSDLVVTGPPVLGLKWGQLNIEDQGRPARAFYPESRHQEAPGYLHAGVAAGAVLDAVRLLHAPPGQPTSVSIEQRWLVPLGHDLRAAALPAEDDGYDVVIERLVPPDRSDVPVEPLVLGSAVFRGHEPAPDLADVRELALMPIPIPQEHELFAGCFVCGQDNKGGLQLLPGWTVPDRVVISFHPDEDYTEGDRKGVLSPTLVCALLSCPTLWACRDELEDSGRPGALLTSYGVRFHGDVSVASWLRVVAFAGKHDEERLRGLSALLDERGEVYATATGVWTLVDEVPERDPGQPDPLRLEQPLKGGRPEVRSPEDWGTPLPGRREEPGPRHERPGERA